MTTKVPEIGWLQLLLSINVHYYIYECVRRARHCGKKRGFSSNQNTSPSHRVYLLLGQLLLRTMVTAAWATVRVGPHLPSELQKSRAETGTCPNFPILKAGLASCWESAQRGKAAPHLSFPKMFFPPRMIFQDFVTRISCGEKALKYYRHKWHSVKPPGISLQVSVFDWKWRL